MSEDIQPVPSQKRNLSGMDFFLLWMGAAIAISEVWAGGMLAPLGFIGGLGAIILGHVIGNTPLALGGVLGSDLGVPAMVSVRVAFGKWGSYLASILNIIQLVGWTAIMIIICAQSVDNITQILAGYTNIKLWMLIAGLVSTFWALVGTPLWKWMQRIGVFSLAILCLFMTYSVLRNVSLVELLNWKGDSSLPWGAGLDLVIAMPISWLPLVSDYSRFARESRSAFRGTWWGYFLASSWMYTLGLLLALSTGQANPIPVMLALNWGIIALVIVFFSTFTTTFLDIYSGAVSFLNLFPRFQGKLITLFFGLGGTILALVFPMDRYENFLYLIGGIFIPLFGVVIFDYFLYRRRRMDIKELYEGKTLDRGALLSWVGGLMVYFIFLYFLPHWGASLPSFFASGLIYLGTRRKSNDL